MRYIALHPTVRYLILARAIARAKRPLNFDFPEGVHAKTIIKQTNVIDYYNQDVAMRAGSPSTLWRAAPSTYICANSTRHPTGIHQIHPSG